MKYFIRISYDGSKFYGFQRLQQFPTVQKQLEEALSKIDRSRVEIKGAGRTDRGVHALGQGVHFSLNHSIPVNGLKDVLNQHLGPYIQVLECRMVRDAFHARFSVLEKKYRYRIYFGKANPFLFDYVLICKNALNISSMKEASHFFLGSHNFQNFVSGTRENFEATIQEISFFMNGSFLDIVFVGKSFYRYMIRNMVGALLDVGVGKRSIKEINDALSFFPYERRFSTAISNGLYLEDVIYSDEEFLD